MTHDHARDHRTGQYVLDTGIAARADTILRDLLSAGPMIAADVHRITDEHGLSDVARKQAAKRIGVRYRHGWKSDAGRVYWCLPEHDTPEVARRFWRR